MIDPVSKALQGLLNAQSNVADAADKIAQGNVSAESMVDLARNSTDVKAQAKNLKLMLEQDEAILDIIA